MGQYAVVQGRGVGFNNGQAVAANGGGAFNSGVAVPLYQSYDQPTGAPKGSTVTYSGSPPFVGLNTPWPYLAEGTNYVKTDG